MKSGLCRNPEWNSKGDALETNIKQFGTNIQHISGVENIVTDMLSRLSYTSINKYNTCKRNTQCCANNSFTIGILENNDDCFWLNILILKIEQKKEPRNINSKLSTYISDWGYGY